MNRLHSLVPCVTLAAFAALAVAAQQGNGASAAPSQTATAVPVQSTASAPEATNAQLRPVTGELVTRINAKKAKAGQPVVIKTTEKAATANGVVIPKGSKILGHITDVQPHTKQNPNSKVTLQFDKAQLKGGQTLPIKSVIESVAPAVSVANNGVDPFGTGVPAAGGGGAPAAGSPSGSSPSGSPGMQPSQTTQTQGSTEAMMSTGQNNGAPKPGTVVVTQGNVAVKTTAIPGVLIATNSNGQPFSNASGALLGAKQNVDLNGGTKVTLAIASMPAGTR
ncbi:MAG: hypothetical protein ACLGSD_17585 [Acidobacteriota bacterium]